MSLRTGFPEQPARVYFFGTCLIDLLLSFPSFLYSHVSPALNRIK